MTSADPRFRCSRPIQWQGQPFQAKFTAALPGSVTFTYTWNYGQPVTVPTGPNGTATVTVTPPNAVQSGELSVFTTTAAGVKSGSQEEYVDFVPPAR